MWRVGGDLFLLNTLLNFLVVLAISDIRSGAVLELDGAPYRVVKADHHKMGRGGAVLRLQLRNLLTGAAVSKTLQGNEKIVEADVARSRAQFMYRDSGAAHFMDQNSFEQFSLLIADLGEQMDYLAEGAGVDVQIYNNNPVAIELPPNMIFAVVEAPEGVKGDTANAPTKTVKIETGLKLQAPLFIRKGEKIKVDTRTGEYLERVGK